MGWKWWIGLVIIASLGFALARPGSVQAAGVRSFPQTGFAIVDPAFSDYFDRRGGVDTFGFPVSREFRFQGFETQIFQRAVMQRGATGQVQLLNLLDSTLFPYTTINGAAFPAVNPAVVQAAPAVGSPNYASAIFRWLASAAPDNWQGLPVAFHLTFLNTVPATAAFPAGSSNAGLLAGFDLEVWGAPTSAPTYDPRNHGFVYQRFQRGILQFDASCRCTRGLLLADYFKAILTGKNLPPDLAAAAGGSAYFGQYNPAQPNWVDRPGQLPATDLTNAFEPDATSAPATPTVSGVPRQTGHAPAPNVNAASIAVVDETSGALLYGRDPHARLAPASLTKIFTALVALRNGQLGQRITVQFDPAQLADSTLMGIHPGETYTLEDLLYGLMLPSGNDAALAIADAIGGSESHFVSLMNAQATSLGLTDSHFANPHGLDATGHYSSAYDLAMAARYGMTHYPEFSKLARARSRAVQGTRDFTVYNLNRFLASYAGADGVKIGYTDNAGKTIVASATRNGHRVYVALMDCGDIVADSTPLFDWVFNNFTWPG